MTTAHFLSSKLFSYSLFTVSAVFAANVITSIYKSSNFAVVKSQNKKFPEQSREIFIKLWDAIDKRTDENSIQVQTNQITSPGLKAIAQVAAAKSILQ